MPNTQTSVPVFTAGQVLTAEQVTQINTGIPVFATTTTRDAAFGGTGEKTLAEGQFAYIEATNTTQYYDGAAWQSVATAPALVCVKAETALSGSSTTADNVFTSTYTNYKIIGRYTNGADALRMVFRVGGVDTATNYNMQELDVTSTTITGSRSSSQTSARIGGGSNGAFIGMFIIELSGVALAEPTIFQNYATRTNSAYTTPNIEQNFGNQSASTAFDGIKFQTASGTLGGSFTIYGYTKTV
jgi:hypothetical protein